LRIAKKLARKLFFPPPICSFLYAIICWFCCLLEIHKCADMVVNYCIILA
jgi:hypothetical protein